MSRYVEDAVDPARGADLGTPAGEATPHGQGTAPSPWWERTGQWFGVDDTWQRPRPEIGRSDVVLVVALAALGLSSLELVRSLGVLDDVTQPRWVQWAAVVSGAALLLPRRRYPLLIAVVAAAHMVAVGIAMPVVMGQFSLQVGYFVALLSAVSWGRDRRAMLVVVSLIVAVMFAWIALQFAIGSAIQDVIDTTSDASSSGLLGPIPAAVLLSLLINVIYFGGALVGGQISWRNARQKAQLADQAHTIAVQSHRLRDQAVTAERLRIARELHDVVAHHVSVIGVQAGAARRVLEGDPDAARTALTGIEASSRDAVTSMRGLLGTLRGLSGVAGDADATDRSPEPTALDLATVIAQHRTPGRRIDLDIVEPRPGAVRAVPGPVAHSVQRIVTEALSNVTRHSTATRVGVVVRITDGPASHVEIEVVDNGRPRGASSGSGLGQLGIRERAALHRGQVDIGPRPTGGYRVRVRLPLTDGSQGQPHRAAGGTA